MSALSAACGPLGTHRRRGRLAIRFFLSLVVCLFCRTTEAKYGGGTGQPNDPYLIYTAEQMNAIGADANDWDKHFKLMADINLSAYTGTDFNIIGTGYFEYSAIGFSYFVGTPFSGTFDGGGHKISNLNHRTSGEDVTDCIGLFGIVDGNNAELKNLSVTDANIVVEGGYGIGTLIGYLASGTVTNCYAQNGNILGDYSVGGLIGSASQGTGVAGCHSSGSIRGDYEVGGLVGSNFGGVWRCCSTASVRGYGHIGGLVGGMYDGEMSGCYSTGSAEGDSYVGGLVGNNRGSISNCYSTASVAGDRSSTGGLAGVNTSTIWNSYSAGSVRGGGGLVGGIDFVGGINGGAFNSYWDVEASGQTASAGGTGKTTSEMQMASTFVGWNACAKAAWTIDEGNDYPRLQWENRPGELLSAQQLSDLVAGSGTQTDPYLIYTDDELNMIGSFPCEWNKHFRLMADIDLAEFTGTSFNIIGYYVRYTGSKPFTGVFDGNSHGMYNFTYGPGEKNVALFGYVAGGEARITALGLIDPNVRGSVYAGSLVGRLDDGIITDCYGIGGSIIANTAVGGLIGTNRGGAIINCHSMVSSFGNDAGGLVGSNRGIIFDSYFNGSVGGGTHVGGLAGYNGGTITNCYSSGSISAASYVGGFVGSSNGVISRCYSRASVVASRNYAIAGGLVGANLDDGVISECYSTGSILADWKFGGLVGVNGGEILDSYSVGQVEDSSGGGLVGDNRSGAIANSFWDMVTSGITNMCDSQGNEASGCFDGNGKTTYEMKQKATFTNWDFIEVWGIAENQTYPFLRFRPAGDLNYDGFVDLHDFAIFASHWLEGVE